MNTASVVRLILLSAIWGASFLFMRIGVPVLGPSVLIFARVALATLFLLLVAGYFRRAPGVRARWQHFLVLAFFNSALPFLLLAWSAQTLSASLLSILNATAPIWAAAIGAAWMGTRLAAKSLLGLLLGIAGVGLLAGVESYSLPAGGVTAILAGLGAACCYGIATIYTRTAASVAPFSNAIGSMAGATLWLLPTLWFVPLPRAVPAWPVTVSVIALGVLCSGVAYLLYFRLVEDIGPTSTLTVTFLIPVFGILWGTLFLDETVGWHTAAGCLVVLTGTGLVTGFPARALFSRQAPARQRQ
ncbi:MAG: DMT family transporter [Betaproteobacteria bacterium]|nr:DMT family transporter [Betaproteobacteria bacterium]